MTLRYGRSKVSGGEGRVGQEYGYTGCFARAATANLSLGRSPHVARPSSHPGQPHSRLAAWLVAALVIKNIIVDRRLTHVLISYIIDLGLGAMKDRVIDDQNSSGCIWAKKSNCYMRNHRLEGHCEHSGNMYSALAIQGHGDKHEGSCSTGRRA